MGSLPRLLGRRSLLASSLSHALSLSRLSLSSLSLFTLSAPLALFLEPLVALVT